MVRLLRVHNWFATPLGPTKGWPGSLPAAFKLVVAIPGSPTSLWGSTQVPLYINAYIDVSAWSWAIVRLLPGHCDFGQALQA